MKHKHVQRLWLATMVLLTATGIYTGQRDLVELAGAGAGGFLLGWWSD